MSKSTDTGNSFSKIRLLGAAIDLLTASDLINVVEQCIDDSQKIVIANHNLHSLCLSHRPDKTIELFRSFYSTANYTVADGMSVIALGWLYGKAMRREHRIAYNDWLPHVLPLVVERGWRVFYLGSSPEASERGAQALHDQYPRLQLEVHHGHFDASLDGEDNQRVLAMIAEYQPHLLFVGMGMPRQEAWIVENLREIRANAILTSGATLDYIAGVKRMAPRWMGRIGMEWAFRLITEPRRLAFRYLVEPWGLVGVILRSQFQFLRRPTSVVGDSE